MKAAVIWSLGGDFAVVDQDDENAPLAELKLHGPLRSLAVNEPELVAGEILRAMVEASHPDTKAMRVAS